VETRSIDSIRPDEVPREDFSLSISLVRMSLVRSTAVDFSLRVSSGDNGVGLRERRSVLCARMRRRGIGWVGLDKDEAASWMRMGGSCL